VAFQTYSQQNGFGIKAGLSSTKVDFKNTQFAPEGAQLERTKRTLSFITIFRARK
jgi:hypothetical protein